MASVAYVVFTDTQEDFYIRVVRLAIDNSNDTPKDAFLRAALSPHGPHVLFPDTRAMSKIRAKNINDTLHNLMCTLSVYSSEFSPTILNAAETANACHKVVIKFWNQYEPMHPVDPDINNILISLLETIYRNPAPRRQRRHRP
jgi:hypothetical protein